MALANVCLQPTPHHSHHGPGEPDGHEIATKEQQIGQQSVDPVSVEIGQRCDQIALDGFQACFWAMFIFPMWALPI